MKRKRRGFYAILFAAGLVLTGGAGVLAEETAAEGAAEIGAAVQEAGADSSAAQETDAADTVQNQVPHVLTPYQTNNFSLWDNEPTEAFYMMAAEYKQGLTPANYDSYRQALYNLDERFSKVTMEVGHIDGERNGSATLYIYKDGELAQTVQLASDMMTQKLELDTAGVKQLRLDQEGGDAAYGYANVTGFGGHNFVAEMTQVVSVFSDGVYTYTCKDCGYSYGETIPEQSACVPYLTPYQATNLYSLEETEDTQDCFYVMGKAYYKGAIPQNYDSKRETLYNLGQKYNSVTFTVGHQDNERNGGALLRVFGDGNLMKEMELTKDMLNQTITINTVGVTQLKISYEGGDSNYAIFDMSYESAETWEHNFQKEVLLEATVGQTGISTYTCVNCGSSYTEIIPAVDE